MAEQELKFKKLADVELVDEAPDTAHALAEVDGEIKRVAGGVGGGGTGGYLVDATADGALIGGDGVFYVTTPVPGLAEALEKGSTVTIKGDIGIVFGSESGASGTYGYSTCSAIASMYDYGIANGMSEEEELALMKDMYIGVALGDSMTVVFTNGHSLEELSSTASLSTLSATPAALKLKGKGGNAVAE